MTTNNQPCTTDCDVSCWSSNTDSRGTAADSPWHVSHSECRDSTVYMYTMQCQALPVVLSPRRIVLRYQRV